MESLPIKSLYSQTFSGMNVILATFTGSGKYMIMINPLCTVLFWQRSHVALDRNQGPGYDTLLLRLIKGDLLSACPHRQFHTLPSLFDSLTLTHCVPCREAVCTIFMMVFGMTRAEGNLKTYRVRSGHANH